LEELEALHWRWTLVGDGSIDPGHAAIVRERIERSPLSARMTWKGALDAAAMPACYRSHDLFVLPSAFETLSMATREALASGLPVIANRVGGIPENLLSGGGVLANPTERENLTLALRRLIEHPALRSRLRAEALSNRVAYSTWAETGGRLLEALGQMAGS
jgi:glycosyltransferase involved in cell wall biosynthesis